MSENPATNHRESPAENGAQRPEGKSLTAFQVEANHLEASLSQDLFKKKTNLCINLIYLRFLIFIQKLHD